ncbi:MAG: NAD(P)/FAD-dependent oxidoreductase [Actinomycetota bacterium]|nr:NAD(P)/FAD-dependent oxidoreductase [Actinomycetota bacterium]
MTDNTHDVIVIGLGVGGEAVAGTLAEAGLDVLGIERNLVGGECPYWGCIPSKMMVRAAGALAETSRVAALAGEAHAHPDYAPVAQRIRDEATDDWNDQIAVDRFEGKGGTFLRGEARFMSPREVEVEGDRYIARRGVVIAAGGAPAVPPIEGLGDVEYWTNREATEAKEAPESLIVLGGGPIGLEIGQAFSRFGTTVTVVEMAPHILPLEEPENARALEEVLRGEGIDVHTAVSADKVRRSADGVAVELSDGTLLGAERLLVATGRSLNLPGLGLEAAGLDPRARSIAVDQDLRAADDIWAVGDVTGEGAFTHIAVYQARIAADDILQRPHGSANYSAVPRVTFTDPEIASVGVSEAQVRDGMNIKVGLANTASSARGWIHGPGAEHGVCKVIADADRGVLIGASVMGPAAGEVIGILTLAIDQCVPIDRLREMIFPYPTFIRGIEDALADLAQE